MEIEPNQIIIMIIIIIPINYIYLFSIPFPHTSMPLPHKQSSFNALIAPGDECSHLRMRKRSLSVVCSKKGYVVSSAFSSHRSNRGLDRVCVQLLFGEWKCYPKSWFCHLVSADIAIQSNTCLCKKYAEQNEPPRAVKWIQSWPFKRLESKLNSFVYMVMRYLRNHCKVY